MRQICAVAALSLGLPVVADARPVSYEGGWTIIEETDRQSSAVWLHYTLNPHLSLGWRTEWDRKDHFVFNGPQATFLAKRWFGENYQANFYAFSGGGITAYSHDSQSVGAVFAGLLADWETRRWFASYKMRGIEGGNDLSSFTHAARFGFAPYEGDTGDLHTWLMVEVDHRPENREPLGVVPFVRFFKGSALFEFGWSVLDNEPLINFTYRF